MTRSIGACLLLLCLASTTLALPKTVYPGQSNYDNEDEFSSAFLKHLREEKGINVESLEEFIHVMMKDEDLLAALKSGELASEYPGAVGFNAQVQGGNAQGLFPSKDAYRNVSELITSKGYRCEEHHVITSDEYVLSIQRIISPKNPGNVSGPVVVLNHGLLDSSTTWVINEAANSLGFMLADQGFDVWMPNNRGNRYSSVNLKHNTHSRKFWKFSWDEMAAIDLPAYINYITEYRNVSQVYYTGHSEGTLIGFTGFAQNQTLGAKIKRFFALAPIITVGHVEGITGYVAYLHSIADFVLNLFGIEDILPSTAFQRFLGRQTCFLFAPLCEEATFIVAGPDMAGFDAKRSDVYFAQFPSGTSLQNMNHWAQMIVSNKCQKYNYGWFHNKHHYGKHHAPKYNVKDLQVPVALFSGFNDYLADPKDVDYLRTQVSTIVYDKVYAKYNHLDFVWGTGAYATVYADIIGQIHAEEAKSAQ